ncbi:MULTISPECIES: GTP cyclohydrolase II [Arcobacteraceae]|uniref:GTP cyclohydrolase-2 n=1 Tax=Poseidonibacter parvus TaxID=1850254 RepID=A0A1P8KM47_9BACT|nr:MULTISPECIES: GTP cyclohydrolase II [Arcobacteraceae]APW65633.1 GTP cyclohydrolase II [Poseidonibacter parvus]
MNIIQSNIANLPTKHGNFRIKAYTQDNQEHLAIMSEDFENIQIPYVRVHSECLTGDALGSLKCDCQNQLNLSLDFIGENGGLVIYHRQEGRNIGLLNKVNAYCLQDKGRNTIEANLELGFKEDERNYKIVKHIFNDLNIKKIKLITNNPHKIEYIKSIGVEIVERIPAITEVNKHNIDYLNTKKDQMGHML